jgi:hypothetical protein
MVVAKRENLRFHSDELLIAAGENCGIPSPASLLQCYKLKEARSGRLQGFLNVRFVVPFRQQPASLIERRQIRRLPVQSRPATYCSRCFSASVGRLHPRMLSAGSRTSAGCVLEVDEG